MPSPDDIAAVAALPEKLRPITPILTREDVTALLPWSNRPGAGLAILDAYDALRGDYLRLASAYVAAHATPAPVPTAESDDLTACKGYVIGYLINGPTPASEIGVKLSKAGFDASDTLDALMTLERAGEIVYRDGAYRLSCDAGPSPADADLSHAAASFRMDGSPFADCRANIPRTVPVAVYRPDMTTGTLPGEAAGEALDDVFRPTCDQVRAAWDADDDDPSPAEAVVVDLAAMKYAMQQHRDASNAIG